MDNKEYSNYLYIEKDDYNKTIKINNEDLKVYSKRKLKKLYPNKDYNIIGETFENKKKNKKKDIGKIEINDSILNIIPNGNHNKFFKKQYAYIETNNGGLIAFLKNRFFPIFFLILLILGIAGGGTYYFGFVYENPNKKDPYIEPIVSDVLTISGFVYEDEDLAENAILTLKSGNKEVSKTKTGSDGKYLFANLTKGIYNLECSYFDSIQTSAAIIDSESIQIDFKFDSNSSLKATIKFDDNSSTLFVNGLNEEAKNYALENKAVDITLLVSKKEETDIDTKELEAIKEISGDLELKYYDFTLLKEIYNNNVIESSEYLSKTNTILEIIIPYDSSRAVGTYVFRYLNDEAARLKELEEKPDEKDFTDATYFVSNNYLYIYTNCLSTYSIGSAFTDHSVSGVDVITYSNNATLNLSTKEITILYKHDETSTNDAIVELYLVATPENLMIAKSDKVPVGYQLKGMKLLSNVGGIPSVGTYSGLMIIKYIDADETNFSTQIEIPLTITITR